MSLTLGEKLRQAREERGISISEVAEQTRISPHYLDSIENNDYRTLPGGIFNKGFVKSYAKYVGVDEQEALQDYARLLSSQETSESEESKGYKPEVLTDDNASSSTLPTIIFAVIILSVMAGGVFLLVNYIQNQSQQPSATPTPAANAAQSNSNSNSSTAAAPVATPGEIKVEFKASETVSLTTTVDGKSINEVVPPDAVKVYTGQESVKLRYYRGFADRVQITVNGRLITSPAAPPKGNGIEFEINKSNIVEIMQTGQIPGFAPGTSNVNANTASNAPVNAPAATPAPTAAASTPSTPKPSSTPAPKPSATATPKPAATAATPAPKPAGNVNR